MTQSDGAINEMRIGVLATGLVGAAIASKPVEAGNEVMMGSRTAGSVAYES